MQVSQLDVQVESFWPSSKQSELPPAEKKRKAVERLLKS